MLLIHIAKFIFVFTICFFLLVAGESCLQAEVALHPSFRNYGTDDGLPSSEVYCIMQDRNGYMWFGTDNGASRFDGYTFTNYGPTNGLRNNVVFDIKEDNRGNLWFGTMTGELFISSDYSSMHAYSYNHLILELSKKFSIANLLDVSSQGVVTIALRGLGILQIDSLGCEQLFTTKAPHGGIILKQGVNIWKSIVGRFNEENYSKVADSHKNMEMMPVEVHDGDSIHYIQLYSASNVSSPFNVINSNRSSDFVIQGYGNLYYVKNNKVKSYCPFPYTVLSNLPSTSNELMVCMNKGEGLRIYASLDAILKGYYEQLLLGKTLTNSFIDRNNGLWVASQGDGVFYCSNLNLKVYDKSAGLYSDFVTALAFKSEQEIFVGFGNGIVSQNNLCTGQSTVIGFDEKVDQAYIFNLYYDFTHNNIWRNGEFHSNNKWQSPKPKPSTVFSNISLLSYYTTHDKNFIWGGSGFGFYKIDIRNSSVVINSFLDYNITDRIYSIYEDTKGHLWIGLQTGIVEFVNDRLVAPKVENPAFNMRVEDIAETPDSTLVFGTKGLGIVFWKGDTVIQLTEKDGLTANMIEDIHVDGQGIVWVGTLSGLNKITYSPLDGKTTIRQITMAQGLPSNEIYQITSCDGQIWLATGRGAVKYHEPPVSFTSIQPIITNLECNSDKVDLTKKLFKYNENNLQIKYIAINYSLNGKVLYRYRLNNIDSWTETYNTSINLPALTPNTYTFEVQAQNEDEIWSSAATFEFTVLAPWWARWPFRLLVASLMVSMLILLYKNRIKQLKDKNEVYKKIYELEGKALQTQMNPHFISNCLTSIQSLVIEGDTESANNYLAKFANLIRAILMSSRQGSIPLEDELEMITRYLSLEKLRFKDNFDFTIDVDPEIDTYDTLIPPMLVQPFIENAVIHAFKTKQNKGLIRITFTPSARYLVIKIIDNGVGISNAYQHNGSQKRVSVGIEIVKSRLALLNKTKSDKNVTFRELKDEKDIVCGTEVEILLYNQ